MNSSNATALPPARRSLPGPFHGPTPTSTAETHGRVRTNERQVDGLPRWRRSSQFAQQMRSNAAPRTRTNHHTPALLPCCDGLLREGSWWAPPWWGSLDGMQGVRGSNPLSSTRHNGSAGPPLRVVCQQIVSKSLSVTARPPLALAGLLVLGLATVRLGNKPSRGHDLAKQRLTYFLQLTELRRPPPTPGIIDMTGRMATAVHSDEIIPAAQVVEQILDRVLSDWRSAQPERMRNRWVHHREAAQRALAQLERDDEIRERLGDAARSSTLARCTRGSGKVPAPCGKADTMTRPFALPRSR